MTSTPAERLRWIIDNFYDKKIKGLADALGNTGQSLSKLLSGEREPKSGFAAKLKSLGFNDIWFLHGQGEIFTDNAAGVEQKKKFAIKNEKHDNSAANDSAVNSGTALEREVEVLRGEIKGLRWTIEILTTALGNHGILMEAASASTLNDKKAKAYLSITLPDANPTEDLAK